MTTRRSVSAVLAAALFLTIAFVVAPAPAGACSCTEIDDAEAFAIADAVFLASVDRVYPARSGLADSPQVAILQVSDVYKGSVVALQGIASDATSASCGFDFITDEVYVVFASGSEPLSRLDLEEGFYEVSLCGGTRLLSDGELAVDASAALPAPGDPPDARAIRDQLGDPRSSLLPELVILGGVLTFVLGLAAAFSWRDKRNGSA